MPALPPEPPYGRRLVEQARIHGRSPEAFVRDIRRGRKLSSGSRRYLEATYTPQGYRIRDEAIAEFYAALTADRLGQPDPPTPRSPAENRRGYERAEVALDGIGI